jgi:hypothetical protein
MPHSARAPPAFLNLLGITRDSEFYALFRSRNNAYRFNRRYELADLVPRLVYVAVRTPPLPARLLTVAGTAG